MILSLPFLTKVPELVCTLKQYTMLVDSEKHFFFFTFSDMKHHHQFMIYESWNENEPALFALPGLAINNSWLNHMWFGKILTFFLRLVNVNNTYFNKSNISTFSFKHASDITDAKTFHCKSFVWNKKTNQEVVADESSRFPREHFSPLISSLPKSLLTSEYDKK